MNKVLKITALLLCSMVILWGCKTAPKKEAAEAEKQDTPAVAEQPTVVPEQKPVEPEKKPEPVKEDTKTDTALLKQNEELLVQVQQARQKAIEAGSQKKLPDQFAQFDEQSWAALSAYQQGGDPKVFNTQAKDALLIYQAFEKTSKALDQKERADNLDLAKYSQAEYDKGVLALTDLESLFAKNGSAAAILDKATFAEKSFTTVVFNGFTALAEAKRKDVRSIKAQADEIKASVADKAGYASALEIYQSAEKSLAAKDPETALATYKRAESSFTQVYRVVYDKRKAAEEAIERAKKRAADVDAFAQQADVIAPLPKDETDAANAQKGAN